MLELRDVWKGYKKGRKQRWILSGASIELPPRRRIALLGAQGSGKTSVLRMMCGLDDPDKGVVRRVGLPCWPLNTFSFLDNTGTLRQNANFLGRIYGADDAQVAAIAADLCGVKTTKSWPLSRYTGADRRLIALGLTLALQFDWYFIDDALPTVPAETMGMIDAAIADRLSRAGVIWATRDPNLVADYCDAGIVLDQGELVFYDDVIEAVDVYRHATASEGAKRT